MIIDYKSDRATAVRYSIFDASTGECLDREGIFFADDEAGYYHRHLKNGKGGKYIWDKRTKQSLAGTFRDGCNPIPDEFMEVAWERVDRQIALRLKERFA